MNSIIPVSDFFQALDLENKKPSKQTKSLLLKAVIEALSDGILILSLAGKVLHANHCAAKLCRYLQQTEGCTQSVPKAIWHLCESLIESRELFPNKVFVIEDSLQAANHITIRVRVQWIEFEAAGQSCLLVTLEDCKKLAELAAIAEAQRFQLTPREAEVWQLKRSNYNYEEIAAQLYISVNTVKKHIKNIYAKRTQTLDQERYPDS
ncbi:helix-turn-helix transcriptional regulator [Almyronema epifaneia]|uniref:Helix-turn-helix transcriptional regulator n=1 Tax=Almyronema epifaneia S1 TaxID=2991925 RepID=A0ABW6IBM9_9CYAN